MNQKSIKWTWVEPFKTNTKIKQGQISSSIMRAASSMAKKLKGGGLSVVSVV